jgi:hypothetical protein
MQSPNPPATELPKGHTPKTQPIVAAQKIIADISSGVYRSPAAALKELVSNAYDADATRVTITTDPPYFRALTIQDDGSGMSIEKFLDVITHIGGSRKRVDYQVSPKFKRPLIGRIGIGMLAVAQLGYRFYVSSSVFGEPNRFVAEVDLEPFHKDDAALMSMAEKKDKLIQIGAVNYVDNIPENADTQYTVISIPTAKRGITSEITGLVRDAVGAQEVLSIESRKVSSFAEIIDTVQSSARADLALDGYYLMLWELGLLSPVNYLNDSPFIPNVKTVEGVKLIKIPQIDEFQLTVDDIDICRPQRFPNPFMSGYAGPNPKLYPVNFNENIAGRNLQFYGYIYAQQPRIWPEELKGLHIRIRNVGIGRHDKSWLGYPFNEGLKFGQLTGEIFVDDGLEDALNIDRDSFRETDVHYQALKAFLWKKLKTEVFPEFKSRQREKSKQKRTQETQLADKKFVSALRELPAPLLKPPAFASTKNKTLLQQVNSSKGALVIDKGKLLEIMREVGVTGADVRDRTLRVLTVLASSELLFDLTDEEFDSLVKALILAIK